MRCLHFLAERCEKSIFSRGSRHRLPGETLVRAGLIAVLSVQLATVAGALGGGLLADRWSRQTHRSRICVSAIARPDVRATGYGSASMISLHRVLALRLQRPDWPVFVGPEEMLADAVFAAAAHGGVNGGASLFPRLYVLLSGAARDGDVARARALHAVVIRVSRGALPHWPPQLGHHQGHQVGPGRIRHPVTT